MRTLLLTIVIACMASSATGQSSGYEDSLLTYQQQYVANHEVVKGKDKKSMQFFQVTKAYRVRARVQRIEEAPWLAMTTSGNTKKIYRVYAVLHFSIHDTAAKLNIYQSKELMTREDLADHLFIPFTDLTSGNETYDNGRYIDLSIPDLATGFYTIDFNKAYNPYCAYVSNEYNCPIPPRENDLRIAIRAGEKSFEKAR